MEGCRLARMCSCHTYKLKIASITWEHHLSILRSGRMGVTFVMTSKFLIRLDVKRSSKVPSVYQMYCCDDVTWADVTSDQVMDMTGDLWSISHHWYSHGRSSRPVDIHQNWWLVSNRCDIKLCHNIITRSVELSSSGLGLYSIGHQPGGTHFYVLSLFPSHMSKNNKSS